MKRDKIIIDTDPGVDDSVAITIAMFNKNLDIKLITTTAGNVGLKTTTRNAMFLLEKFNKNIPVASGAEKPLFRNAKNAINVHGKEGLGEYIPEDKRKFKKLRTPAVDAMYKVITENPHEITILEIGPHTNVAQLFIKYPDSINLIKQIIFEGGSPYGKENVKPHISFNISFDPEAADIVMRSNIKKTMIPSEIGRYIVPFSKTQVEEIKNLNSTGEFFATMFEGYLSPETQNVTETNDLSALMYLLYPQIFKTYKCYISVNTTDAPGKTIITENENGIINFVEDVDKFAFFNMFIENLKNIKD